MVNVAMIQRWREFFTAIIEFCKYPALISSCLCMFLPSKKDVLILGGIIFAKDEISKTGDQIKTLPPKLMELINARIDEFIGEKKKTKDDEIGG